MLKKIISIKILVFLLFFQTTYPVLNFDHHLLAQEQKDPNRQKILDQAQRLYYEGQFTEAVNLVRSCLTDEAISTAERIRAYKILSQVAMARDNDEQAREIIRQIIKLDPEYRPTIDEEPPRFVKMVEEVRQGDITPQAKSEVKEAKSGLPSWLYYTAAGAAVLTGTLIYIVNGENGSKKNKPLDLPPDWPSR